MKVIKQVLAIVFLGCSWWSFADDGLIQMTSMHDVDTTMSRLEKVLVARGMTIFTKIDHAQGARSVGNTLPETQVLLFGNPKIGTPLMLCQPGIAIDLPQKMLVWQGSNGETQLAYNDPMYLAQRHGFGETNPCYPILEKVSIALANFTEIATGLSDL
ncbi:MAG: DUF302 domain-containing protein [Aestuariibacter sp.]